MKSKHYRFSELLIIMSMITLGSCSLFESDEISPTTIQLQPFEFNVTPGQGTAMNRITEVWVYANNKFLGAFTPPVNIYYLESGPTTFNFKPGIRNNGILVDAITYPIFSDYSINLEAAPGAVFEVNPNTAYRPEATFSLNVDFEFNNPFTDNHDTVAASNVLRSSVDVFEGDYAGQITMSEEASFIEVGHDLPLLNLPKDGTPIYLEMRYKSEIEMSIGLLGTNLGGESFTNFFYLVNPKDEWNMLYIDLTELIQASDLPSYKILFRSLYPNNPTKEEYNIFLDNIKVVHL